MTLARETLVAIGRAVEARGGTIEDAVALAEAWEDLLADRRGRVDRLRYEGQHPRCRCADRPDLVEGRCPRCYGERAEGAAR
jgi:hypothetical protein